MNNVIKKMIYGGIKMIKKREVIISGFALFAMLFGAGNLIFPPMVGFVNGESWNVAVLGFILTGAGFPLLAILTSAFSKKDLDSFAKRVSPIFAKIFNISLILAIGPLLALPRTGATSFEIIFSSENENYQLYKFLFIVIFFLITLLFSLKSSKVVDRVGAILTPILLLVLAIIIVKGVFFPVATPMTTELKINPFRYGFENGYQTMDTLAAIVFSDIILKSIKKEDRLSENEEKNFLVQVSLIAIGGLAIVYGGLSYIGATMVSKITTPTEVELLAFSVKSLLGDFGKIVLAICVVGACITTAIGLTATVGNYFSTITRISYEKIVFITIGVSIIFALFGVNNIVTLSVPVLLLLYPIAIALIILNFFEKYILSDKVFRFGVLGAGIGGVCEMMKSFGVVLELYDKLPFAKFGLSWLTPFITLLVVGKVFTKLEKNN